jgi:branched-chain amino acid transport system permease protein
MSYLWHLLVLINLYISLALALNLLAGYTGLLSLCHAAFYGIGAYATALLVQAGWGFLPAVLAAVLLTAVLSLVVAIPSLRLRGDYFVLATLGFQIIVSTVLYNWTSLTRGPFGLSGIPVPSILGWEANSAPRYFVFSGLFTGLAGAVLWGLIESPFGRVLKAIREDELAAASLGKNVEQLKVTAFAISGGLAALSGGLFAGYMRFIDPTSFTLNESIFVLSIVIIGGAGSFVGPPVGAVLLVLLPEVLRALRMPEAVAASLRQVIYGLLLVLLMLHKPQGLLGDYQFDRGR